MTRRTDVLLALALAATAAGACGQPAPEETETTTVVPVTVEAARVGTIRAVIHATGVVGPAPGADLIVTAPEPARILELPKAAGDRVRRGDVLVRFDIPSRNADVAARKAAVSRAEARLRNAQAARTRAHDLFDRGIAARKEVEDADRELADAEAALAEATAAREASAALAARAVVRATFDGVVARRFHNPGDLVDAAAGDPILRVIDPDRLEVAASVPVSDLSHVVVGAAARIVASGTDAADPLEVVSRPAAVDPNTATAPVRLAFTAPTRLAAGTPVQVAIDADEHAGVVLVPASALVHEGDAAAVFVAADGKARRRAVSVGIADEAQVEIRSGVTAGEPVITRGQAGLPDGTPITTRGTDPAGP